ncbi:MAG: alanine:cation symporter family protein [Enterocloster bolteae]
MLYTATRPALFFVAICLFFFAFSTILGWNLFAKINVTYLFGKKAQRPFMLVALVFIFLGTIGEEWIWYGRVLICLTS